MSSRKIMARDKGLARIGKELDQWARFKKHNRELFAEMVQLWVISMQNAWMPRDEAWTRREAEYARLIEHIGIDGRDLMATALAELTRASIETRADHLGELYNQMEATNKAAGQFFTPYSVSRLMAEMNLDRDTLEQAIAKKGHIMANEPACGSGGMIIALAEAVEGLGYDPSKVLRVYATDIDRIPVNITFVQTTLQRIPCFVEQADALDPTSGERFGYQLPNVHYASLLLTEAA